MVDRPEGVAAARARGIREATAGHGTLPVRVELRDGAPVATVDWGAESPSLASGLQLPVRITIATAAAGAGQPSIRHRVTEIVTSADTTTTTHPIETPLPEDVEMAVVIEDLRLRVWGAARLRLP